MRPTGKDELVKYDVWTAGAVLKRKREALGMTLLDVEKWSGIISMLISRIENGKVEKPSMQDLCAIGKVYGLDANQIAAIYGY